MMIPIKATTALTAFLAIVVLQFSTGCACARKHSFTYNLWSSDAFRARCSSAPDPHLEVFAVPNRDEFLVTYDEIRERGRTIQRKAYFVRENGDAGERGRRPRFVSPVPQDLVSIAVNPTNATMPFVTESNSVATIHLPLEKIGPMPLPSYLESSGLVPRLALTPVAAIADATLFGVLFGLSGTWVGSFR